MTREEYARLRDFFLRAVDLGPAERAAFVDAECPSELREKLRGMLASHKQGEFVERSAPPEPPQESLSGRRIGRYQVAERIGEGGMSVIYRAEDVELQRAVALKFLSFSMSTSAEGRERFVREARAAAAIDHPNVCPVYEIHAEGERPFIAMAFLEGRTVAEALAEGPLGLDVAVDVAIQACRGLEAAHAKGIVHRDVKPSNLMLTPPATGSGAAVVKILDFGVALFERERTLTRPGASLGTIGYMSPEQIESGMVDPRSDLWSLGATLYEALTGNPAFDRGSPRELAAAIVGAAPTPITEYREETPPALAKLIHRLLRKSPEDRYASAADVREALEAIDVRALPAPLQPRSLQSRRWGLWTAGAAAVLALAIVGGVWITRSREPREAVRARSLEPRALTSLPGIESDPAISPDGRSVAFVWDGGEPGRADLYVQPVDGAEPRRLTHTMEREASPTWSPDGTRLAFVRRLGDRTEVRVMPAAGGAEKLLREVDGDFGGASLDWQPGGDLLAVRSDDGILGIRVSAPNEPPIRYKIEGARNGYPQFDPSGERLAFVASRSEGPISFVVVPASGDHAAAKQYPDPGSTGSSWGRAFAWNGAGTHLIYSEYGESPFYALRLADGVIETLPIAPQIARFPHVRGDRMAYSRRMEWSSNVWAVDLPEGPLGSVGESRILVESPSLDHDVRMSPDGRFVVFCSDRSGYAEVWRSDRDGGAQKQLTAREGVRKAAPAWSPDNRQIAFQAQFDGPERDIYVIDAEGGEPRRITTSPASDLVPSWSADGKWIYFASDRGGAHDVWRIRPEGGALERVTTGGGFETIPSPDGRYLFYSNPASERVIRRDLSSGEEIDFPQLGAAARERFWQPTATGIFFLNSSQEPGWIQFLDFETRSVRKICAFGVRESGPRPIAATADGTLLLFVQRDRFNEDVMLVDGLD